MKNTRLIFALTAMCALVPSMFAPSFAVLLGGSSDTKSADADHKDWIEIQSIAWTPAAAKDGAAGKIEAPAGSVAASENAKGVARREYEPVILTVRAEGKNPALKKAFTKGRKLGTIRLRDGERVLVLHDVIVADVKIAGPSETVSLNYTKIENAQVPERAKAKIRAAESGRAP